MSEMNIHHLLFAVVQEQDTDTATRALEALGLPVVFLSSAGGFLGRRNATLLIGLHEGKVLAPGAKLEVGVQTRARDAAA